MTQRYITTLTLLLSLTTQTLLLAERASVPLAPDPEIIVAKVHADWCASCQVVEPHFQGLRQKFLGEPVLFLVFDRTDEGAIANSAKLAKALNLDEVFAEHTKTGELLVIDTETEDVIEIFTKEDSRDAMGSFLRERLE